MVSTSICKIVRDIFDGGVIDKSICKSLIILIPKIEKPKYFNQFRPISLCNTIYKIITKIIANRFKLIMNK